MKDISMCECTRVYMYAMYKSVWQAQRKMEQGNDSTTDWKRHCL